MIGQRRIFALVIIGMPIIASAATAGLQGTAASTGYVSVELFVGVVTAVLLPVIGWSVWLGVQVHQLHRDIAAVEIQLAALPARVGELTAAIQQLTHYTRWMGEQVSGKTAPPPTLDVGRAN